jgi:glycolate oxidase
VLSASRRGNRRRQLRRRRGGGRFGAAELELFRGVKRAFDPHALLNPGKAVPSLARCAEYGRMRVHGGRLPHAELPRF